MVSVRFKYLVIILLVFMFTHFGEAGEMPESKKQPEAVRAAALDSAVKKVAGKRIYFGHQSVGFNILDGINDIVKEHSGSGLNIVKTTDPQVFRVPAFAHSTLGENEHPDTKINDFASYMDKGIGGQAEIAFFKFCYLDVNKSTDTDKVFAVYKETMERLKARYPGTRFIHVTVPLTVSKVSVKSLIKWILGREDNNINRNLFNEKLMKEYGGKDPIFDLAKLESSFPDGSRSTFTAGGKTYYSLAPDYAEDSGHLNEKGRRMMAAELLTFLSQIESHG